MALSWKSRRWLSLLVLVVGLPLYIIVAVTILNRIGDLPLWVELPVYVILGVAWAFPFKSLFRGIGQADPNADEPKD